MVGEEGPLAVETLGLCKTYVSPLTLTDLLRLNFKRKRQRVLSHLSLGLESGLVHAFVGPNGAGKTTLLKLIAALLKPTSGRIEVFGLDTRRAESSVRRMVGYCMTGARSFYLRLSAYENLRFFAALQGLRGREREQRVWEVLEQFELAGVAQDRVLTFSEGMCQRLSIARAVLHKPPMLLLDEISRGLGPRLRERVYSMVRGWAKRHANGRGTVLLASHNMEEVASVADRVYVLDRGEVVARGAFSEVEDTISGLFGTEGE